MQTESRTYRKGHMLALPVARPGTEAQGGGGGGEKQRNREDKRQLSEHRVPATEAALTTHPAASALQAPRPGQTQLPQGMTPKGCH